MTDKPALQSNIPEFSVSELAFSLKRTLEDTYGRVRIRGELSRISIPKSGHMYSNLKDESAVIDIVCWKGVLAKQPIKPEEGMEVICTGKVSTYPGNSRYQLIIETIELAGEGALLKMLEERKKKLATEGLFAPEQKQKIPFLPNKIGVVTSPTGAVIRDILHRLNDRFPRHVMVWPVKVQGEGADIEITNAINGFNALPEDQKPDTLIVARGGGSLEDLMAFNEENVVRAVAASKIPVISAVGHETDTTLIDYAADLRAPTPTGAAEMAVPVRINLIGQVTEGGERLLSGMNRLLSEQRHRLEAYSAKLGEPSQLLNIKTQSVDRLGDTLEHALKHIITDKQSTYTQHALRLTHPSQLIDKKKTQLETHTAKAQSTFRHALMTKSSTLTQTASNLSKPEAALKHAHTQLERWEEQLAQTQKRTLDNFDKKLDQSTQKLEILSFENVLKRGYVVVRDENNEPVSNPSSLKTNQSIHLQFKENKTISATINKSNENKDIPKKETAKPIQKKPQGQGSLF
ncbi:MAG: exodeoxyribonuclease VII large subunit [Alphaproteobacteria bacterium]